MVVARNPALIVCLVVVIPAAIGVALGAAVAHGGGPRHPFALASMCDASGVFVLLVIITAQTPSSACDGTGCDNEYGVGLLLALGIAYLPAVLGVLGGRSLRNRLSS
jgi:hypothetical protein